MIENQHIWQIGTGDATRDYSKLCLDFGIAIVGPGAPGDSRNPETEKYYKKTGLKDWGKCLMEIKEGDIVLLRRGQTLIKAVGVVVKGYDFSLNLSDIHGWDLNHFVTAEWCVKEDETDIVLPSALIGYSTMSSVEKNYEKIKDIINNHNLKRVHSKRKLGELKYPNQVNEDDIKNHLIESGIRISDAFNITETIGRIIVLVKWYTKNDPTVLEHELRTFMVIPFLLSLGWSEQKIKIEYYKVDIALFEQPYKKGTKDEPLMLIETKTFDDGLLFAQKQLDHYASDFPNCKQIVTTNGYRYCYYKKQNKEFDRYCYFNLLDMREFDYIDNDVKGVLDGIIEISNF